MLVRVGLCIKETKIERFLERALADADAKVESFGGEGAIWQKVIRSGYDIIVISEALLPRPVDNSIMKLNELPESPTTVIIHASDSAEAHARLSAAGADVVLFAGISRKSMVEALESILESRHQFITRKRFDRRGQAEPKIADFVSDSRVMQLFMEEVHPAISSDSPILLLGETGVGKEHLAKAIHAEGPRSNGPFISVNMAGMPEQLIESELFGHEQGAFTGALRYRRGAFELAHGGTIFLDEIGDMPLHMQVKLLQVLQNYEIRPVGGENRLELDVRVISATNRDLESEIEQGRFRQDLFYRLSVLMLTIPPLRDRREDLPKMVRHFMTHYRYKIGRELNGISDAALQALYNYNWPGNIRELMNVIERAILLCKNNAISLTELPMAFQNDTLGVASILPGARFEATAWEDKTLADVKKEVIGQVEKLYLQKILEKTAGRVGKAARLAGIHPRGLYDKMKILGLRKEDFK